MKPIVVVPTYNEIENLERIVTLILEQPGGFHILIVDDNSPDGTGRLADELSRRHPGEIHVLHRERKEGLGRAYVAGFGQALKMPEYDAIIQMDADLSHDPSYLPTFLKMLEKCDMVLGSRYLHGISVVNWDFKRLVLSKGASLYVKLITSMPYSDATGGFKSLAPGGAECDRKSRQRTGCTAPNDFPLGKSPSFSATATWGAPKSIFPSFWRRFGASSGCASPAAKPPGSTAAPGQDAIEPVLPVLMPAFGKSRSKARQ